MKLDRVKFKDERPYIERIVKSGKQKGQIYRKYGQIIVCQNCGQRCFVENCQIKRGNCKFCSKKCANQLKNNPRWKNGRSKHRGYILIKKPNHPNITKKGYIREHRLIVEKQIGRYLHRWEVVHHINEIRDDNRPEKLIAFKSNSAHKRFEQGGKVKSEEIIFDGRKLKTGSKSQKKEV